MQQTKLLGEILNHLMSCKWWAVFLLNQWTAKTSWSSPVWNEKVAELVQCHGCLGRELWRLRRSDVALGWLTNYIKPTPSLIAFFFLLQKPHGPFTHRCFSWLPEPFHNVINCGCYKFLRWETLVWNWQIILLRRTSLAKCWATIQLRLQRLRSWYTHLLLLNLLVEETSWKRILLCLCLDFFLSVLWTLMSRLVLIYQTE